MTTTTQFDYSPLKGFIGRPQLFAIGACLASEEGEYFEGLMKAWVRRIAAMPQTYEQEELGEQALVHLHYFTAGCDWYITERDSDPDGAGQVQAFGYANLGDPDNAELGYISITELIENGAELDLYWTVKPLADVKARRS